MVIGSLPGIQTVTKALPASAHTPGSVFIVKSAAARAQSTAFPPFAAISRAASAASAEVVATATLVNELSQASFE